jgi:hypothetical protein
MIHVKTGAVRAKNKNKPISEADILAERSLRSCCHAS